MLLNSVGSLVVVDRSGVLGIVTCEDLRALSPEMSQLLEAARCVHCSAGSHLRPGPNGHLVCVDCLARLERRQGTRSRPSFTPLGASR